VWAKVDKVLAILGPTCTGKSELALDLAGEMDGEIVNADSMQVYKDFDIGTAKPDEAARSRIPHHLIDVVVPTEQFNGAAFKRMADEAISLIQGRGKVPITVGGTGLYLRILFHGLFPISNDAEVRRRLRESFETNPLGLYEELKGIDPEYALRISHRDRVRVVRALEVYYVSGTRMSDWQKRHHFGEKRYNVYKIGLMRPRPELYARIDGRVEEMLRQGWIEEVKGLLDRYGPEAKPFSGIGYREIMMNVKGLMTEEEMKGEIQKSTRHYAKRQITWFRKETEIDWFTYPEERSQIIEKARAFLCLN